MIPATCHPDRKHYANGMCRVCYNAEYRQTGQGRLIQAEAQAKYLKSVKGVAANRKARQRYQSLYDEFMRLDDLTYFNYERAAAEIPVAGVSAFTLWLEDQRKQDRGLSPSILRLVLTAAEAD